MLLASYNGELYIQKQIESILNQNGVNVSIFINDDCSSDSTITIVRNIIKLNNNVHLIGCDNKYGSASKNFFSIVRNIQLLDFDYVAFSDQDDYWFPDKLEFSINELENTSSHGFSSNVTAYWLSTEKKKEIIKSYPQKKFDHLFESPGPGCSQVFTIDSFKIFQNFLINNYIALQEIDYHDWFIYSFYRVNGFKWHISPISKMFYIQHDGNQIGANNGIGSVIRRFNMIRSRWYRNQVNLTYKLTSGDNFDIVNFAFMSKNILQLRRKTSYSLGIYILLVLGIL